MRGLAAALATGGVIAGLAVAGCGSSSTNPPPAEPASSPPLTGPPAGRLVPGVSGEAEGIAVDPTTGLALVSFREPDRLELIDVRRGRGRATIPVPDPSRHLELARPGGPVLVPVEYDDLLLEVSLPAGRVTSKVPVGDFPHDAAEAADGRIFVGAEGGDEISVVDGGRTAASLPAPEQPGGVAISGNVVAAVAVAARQIAFYDTDSLEQTAVLTAGAGPSHVVAGDDGRFYVADTGGDAILVYRTDPEPELIDRTNLPGSPYGLAIDNRRDRLWVTRTGTNEVTELELTDLAPKVVRSFPTVRQPNSVGVDERSGRVVVVGRDRGQVQIIDPGGEGSP